MVLVCVPCADRNCRHRAPRLVTRAAEDGDSPQVDGIAKAMSGKQVNKNMVLVVGATGTLGRQVNIPIVPDLQCLKHPIGQNRTCSCALYMCCRPISNAEQENDCTAI